MFKVKFIYKDGWTKESPEVDYATAKDWFDDTAIRFGVVKIEMIHNGVISYSLEVK